MSEVSNQPKTWFSGTSSPEDQRQIAILGALVGVIIAVASPAVALAAFATWIVFSRVRVSHKVIFAFLGIYAVVLLLTGLVQNALAVYIQSFASIFETITSGDFAFTDYLKFALMQAPLGLLIGGVIGTAYSWWRFIRQPGWQKMEFRRTPIEYYRRKKTVEAISKDDKTPTHGMTLGIDDKTGKRQVQSWEEAAAHTFVVGASGSGKTTTTMLRARDAIANGHAYVIIDLKGGRDVPAITHEYASRYGRPFYHWEIRAQHEKYDGPAENGLSYYTPLSRGDASRRKDMIIAGRKWTEDYYRIIASNYLQIAFNVAIGSPPEGDTDPFTDIIALLTPETMKQRAKFLPTAPAYDEIREAVRSLTSRQLDKGERSAIDGLRRELQLLRVSSAGAWLRHAPTGKDEIDFRRVVDEGAVVVFSLDSSAYPELSKQVANLIIQDLKTVTSELRSNPSNNTMHIDIDEFSALDSENIIGLINKSRDAKMPVTLSTQALGDLRKINPTFLDQLIGIVNAFIIHRANMKDDAEVYAGLTGQGSRWDVRYAVEHTSGGPLGGMGKGAATGDAFVAEVEDFNVAPKKIQELSTGEMIYIAKSPKPHIDFIKVIPEAGISTGSDKHVEARTISDVSDGITEDVPLSALSDLTPSVDIAPAGRAEDVDYDTPDVGYLPDVQEPAPPIKKSTGFLGGRDLNAALGRATPSATPEEPTLPTTQREANPAPRQPMRPAPLPTRPASDAPAPVRPPLPKVSRPARPLRPGQGASLPTTLPHLRPATPEPVEEPAPQQPAPSVTPPRKTAPKKASRPLVSEEWD